jgi:phosphoenolpyruvate carboxykinase (GTP)
MATTAVSIPTTNKHLMRWVEKMADLIAAIFHSLGHGSEEEYGYLCDMLVEKGTVTRLNSQLWPRWFSASPTVQDR